MWKIQNLTQQNIVPLKPCILYINFYTKVFIQRCVCWLSGTCFVKDNINLDITLSETKFDYSVVKRWVAYDSKKNPS